MADCYQHSTAVSTRCCCDRRRRLYVLARRHDDGRAWCDAVESGGGVGGRRRSRPRPLYVLIDLAAGSVRTHRTLLPIDSRLEFAGSDRCGDRSGSRPKWWQSDPPGPMEGLIESRIWMGVDSRRCRLAKFRVTFRCAKRLSGNRLRVGPRYGHRLQCSKRARCF